MFHDFKPRVFTNAELREMLDESTIRQARLRWRLAEVHRKYGLGPVEETDHVELTHPDRLLEDPLRPFVPVRTRPDAEKRKAAGRLSPGEWKRIERRIYSKWWRAAHNLLAHPLLAIYRPLGEKLHAYTAEKMYQPKDGVDPVETDSD